MPDTFNLSDVFISYSRKDTDFVRRVSSELKARKREVWVDWEDIPLTADWWAEIQAGIEAANTFIFIISPDSVASDICRKEIDHAVAANKRFVPVLYRDLTDQAQQEMMHPIISTHNWIFFREADDFNRAFDRLLKALETDLDHARKHTRFLVRAREWEVRSRDSSYFLGATDLSEAEAWLASSGSKEPRPTDLQTEYILASRYAQTSRQRRLLLGVSVALVAAVGLAILSIFLANQASTQATIAVNNAATATIAQGQAIVEANNAATQAAIAENNAATATIAQGRAIVEADNAATQAAIAQIAATAEANARSTSIVNEQIAVNAAVTATIAQGQALIEADNAATQAAIAEDNAATATIAQGRAIVEADNAATQAAIARTAAEAEANARSTSVVNEQIAVNAAVTATIAQGQALIQADNAATQAAIARTAAEAEANARSTSVVNEQVAVNAAVTATIAQGQALIQADNAATQAASARTAAEAEANARSTSVVNEQVAVNAAVTATIAQGRALIEADRAETQAAIALNNAATATIAQGIAIYEAATAESAQATAIYNESQARAQAMAVNAEQLLEAGNTDLAIALAIEASRLNPELAQAQRLLNRANSLSARLNLESLRNNLNRMSTDERYLLTLDSPQSFVLWELSTRQPIYQLREHQADISTVVFSADAKYLVSGDESGVIVVWEVATGRALYRLNAHGARVSSLAFSPWGDPTFASGGDDAAAVMWNAETGAEIFRLEGHAGPISKVAFNFESQTPEVFSYSMNTSSPGMGILPSPPDQGFRALRVYRGFSPNGQFAYTGGDGTDFLTLWDPDSLTEIRAFPLGNANQDYVTAIAFSWFDTLLVHVESRRRGQVIDRRLALWDVKTGSEIRRFDVRQDNPELWEIYSLAMSVDGRYALSGGRFGRVFAVSLWEVATGKEIRRFTGHNEAILNVDFSAFGRYAVSSTANDLRVWDISEREISQENRITPSTTAISDLGFSPDGQIVFGNVAPLGLGAWNTTSGADLIIPIAIGSAPVAYSPRQPYVMTASTDPSTPYSIVTLWDMISAEYVYRDNGLPINASALAFNLDGQKAIFGGIRGGVVLWDVSQRSVLRRFDTAEPITQIVLASDERLAAGLTSTNEIVLWDMIAGIETRRLGGYEGQIGKIEFSPDGNSIAAAVGEPDNTVLVWDTQTGEQLLSLLGGHRDSVNTLAFSPDGESLLSASDDSSLILWDLSTGQPLRRFNGHTRPVNTVAISADGRRAASANRQDGIILWRIETLEETVAWTQANRTLLELSCAQRLQYNAQPLCNQRGIVPTPTATWTPLPTATPTVTPTPTLTPTATATAVPMGIIESSSASVNLRSGAGEGFRVIAQTRPGIEVVILEVDESQAWIKVRLPDGTEGWVTSFVVRRQ